MSFVVKDPRFPLVAVEAMFRGERRVLLCTMEVNEAGAASVGAPFALLLTENDFKDCKPMPADGEQPPPPNGKIILTG